MVSKCTGHFSYSWPNYHRAQDRFIFEMNDWAPAFWKINDWAPPIQKINDWAPRLKQIIGLSRSTYTLAKMVYILEIFSRFTRLYQTSIECIYRIVRDGCMYGRSYGVGSMPKFNYDIQHAIMTCNMPFCYYNMPLCHCKIQLWYSNIPFCHL